MKYLLILSTVIVFSCKSPKRVDSIRRIIENNKDSTSNENELDFLQETYEKEVLNK